MGGGIPPRDIQAGALEIPRPLPLMMLLFSFLPFLLMSMSGCRLTANPVQLDVRGWMG
jgi:hypothetical protein